jgi:hypothetical protein
VCFVGMDDSGALFSLLNPHELSGLRNLVDKPWPKLKPPGIAREAATKERKSECVHVE